VGLIIVVEPVKLLRLAAIVRFSEKLVRTAGLFTSKKRVLESAEIHSHVSRLDEDRQGGIRNRKGSGHEF
jgi:hypothetical protein